MNDNRGFSEFIVSLKEQNPGMNDYELYAEYGGAINNLMSKITDERSGWKKGALWILKGVSIMVKSASFVMGGVLALSSLGLSDSLPIPDIISTKVTKGSSVTPEKRV